MIQSLLRTTGLRLHTSLSLAAVKEESEEAATKPESVVSATMAIEELINEHYRHTSMANSQCGDLLKMCGWACDRFSQAPDFKEILKDLETLLSSQKVAHRLRKHIKDLKASLSPMPVDDPWMLQPLISLYTFNTRAKVAMNENDIKSTRANYDSTKTTLIELFRSIEDGDKQVSHFIGNKQRQAVAKEKTPENDSRKAELQKKKEEETAAKAKPNAKVSASFKFGACAPSALFDIESTKIVALQTHQSVDSFDTWRTQDGETAITNFTKAGSLPYLIKAVDSLKTLTTDKEMKSDLAIFQVQFTGSVQAKERNRPTTTAVESQREDPRDNGAERAAHSGRRSEGYHDPAFLEFHEHLRDHATMHCERRV